MEPRGTYPPADIGRAAGERAGVDGPVGARIAAVAPDSPAYDAGFEAGCTIVSVDGEPLRDVIDWRWLASDSEITLGYVDLDGDAGEVELWREPGEEWGFEFAGLVFDGVKQCRNACTFCFMRMLPDDMRSSLYVRDDDFRLSFLVGTFVTLTNITPEDEARICEQRISPLRVSLQAVGAQVRKALIGKHAQHGIEVLDRLLDEGIQFHAQIVLVPDVNDGEVLVDTLEWAYARPGILGIGIVPLGYTRHQATFDSSFNSAEKSQAVLDLVAPFQERALEERGTAWVFPADEFYRNAYGERVLDHLPPARHYGSFEMFEDGIGIIRSTVEDWREACSSGAVERCAKALRASGGRVALVAGLAQREFLDVLVRESGIEDVFAPLYVHNAFFGGNVDVTGLLVGADIVAAVRDDACGGHAATRYLVPRVVFNDDGVTLDDMTLEDMEKEAGLPLRMVSCSPKEYFEEIIAITES